VDGSSLLVRKGSGLAGVQDLGAKRVAVIPGTTTEKALREALQKSLVVAQIVSVKDHREGLAALEGNLADAYASDRTLLVGLAITAQDPNQFALADQYLSYEPYGFMVRRGDSPFRLGVNRVLSHLYRSGEIAQIYARWFGKLGSPSSLLLAMYALHALPE
jgi:ABC-type amino acid transport substrate-binding protein